ncbi:MAG: tetratricopeptide repeat protein [Gammaproteobacteria bacterium]|nr:MAG: tetratricopeptide repeat protein [Gammaproteobacteria bacterium]
MIGRTSGEAIAISSSFFEELKRRNVVKVAVLYLIASWLLLQVTDVLSSLLPVPEWAGSFVFMLLVLGFFPALIFSWVYEMTPEGLKKEKDIDRSQSITPETGHKINVLIIVLLVLAIGGLVVDRLVPETERVAETPVVEEAQEADEVDPAQLVAAKFAPPPDRSIAVLPFVNMSSDQEQEYFSDGLSEELLNLLAKVPELQVAARTSSFSLKGKDLQISEVGEVLKVAHVLEGSVRKSGNQVRITAQLIHADDGYHMWSETYDRRLDDVFAIQDEIAAAVVSQLKVTLLGEAPKVDETDPEAYALFLQARHLAHQFTSESIDQAIVLYKQALSIAPDYAAAWAGLSNTYIDQASISEASNDSIQLARETADKALAADPEHASAHAALGRVARTYHNDLTAAAQFYARALELAPTDLDILRNASDLAQSLGRLDEAIGLGQYVVARDPVDANSHYRLGLSYLWAGRSDAAITPFHTALKLSPERFAAQYAIGQVFLHQGDPEQALAAFQQEDTDEEYRVKGMAMALHDLGRREEYEAKFSELRERWGGRWPSEIAQVYAWTGDADAAFEWLDKSIAQNEDGLVQQFLQLFYVPIHEDPRWLAFREKTGTSEAQLAAIEFEVDIPK